MSTAALKPASDTSADAPAKPPPTPQKRGVRFWLIIAGLSITGLLVALEATIVSTALPSIIADLGGADSYVWVIMAYFLTMTSFQPLYGQLADIFGRRYLTILAVAIFTLGSGLCGGADNLNMMIAGRAIQGLGGSGINVLVELIICDIIPLRERGTFMGIIFGAITLGTALGPLFAGLIVEYSTWRWVFYLNLPVAGVALVVLTLFLQVKYDRKLSIGQSLKRIDYFGNALFIASCVSTLIALGWAGTVYPWSSFRILVPLILGFAGFAAFLFYEGSRFAVEPIMPLHLFKNRTSSAVFIITFFHSLASVWVLYFMPVYFQGVRMSTPARSGVQLLPTVVVMIPFGGIGGKLLEKYGKYKPIHLAAFAIMVIGYGLLTLLDENSSTAEWVIFQIVESIGFGLILAALLPALQAKLSEADSASSTATWGFIRAFGMVWGSIIPSSIFNNRFDQLAGRISDVAIREQLSGGHAYEHATKAFVSALPTANGVRDQVISVFSDSLKRTWQIGITFVGLGFLFVFMEEQVELRKDLETEYGLDEKVFKDEEKDSAATEPRGKAEK
ncbi:uncharacterized protein K452DRAFT_256263 [Aplosporella prunicola CBS 121167]|uniref:Major facilitator superfamily (MFS) profile domain-containing protein n=1 Tax=Aplosporella prunicola CBS 121167 TaxID=1176127 RepID=A0A6A6B6L5_9PEZI|nr:uncharacterized protein K452DRAFT_256263 [Aplosporella prunicola CBS 121167]KAF2138627.1 hypothetical protein K452DRAFT_256263 [Aplosporella prunicola CBS 121167]